MRDAKVPMPMKAFTFDVIGGSPGIGGRIVVVASRKDSALRQAKSIIALWNNDRWVKWISPKRGRYSLKSEEPTLTVHIDGPTVIHAFSGES